MTAITNDTFFKTLDGVNATNGGRYRYPGVGRTTRHLDGELQACEYGFHLARGPQLLDWLAPTIYIAEPCAEHEPIDADGKWVTCRVTLVEKLIWDDRIARLFAADMAESALLGERASGREPDERSWAAITAARQYANGEIGDAAWDAARVAARAAAGDRAGAAAWAAAGAAAGAVAGAAAWAAAGAAAGAAAWVAARVAAGDAAGDAAFERLTAYLTGSEIPPVTPLYGRSWS